MIEDRPHRNAAEPATALPRRLRAWLGLAAEPSLHRRRTAGIEPVRRSWLAAYWQARISVRAGVPLDDFLRSRLARYLAGLPVARGRLPIDVDVDDGQLVVHPAGPERRPADAAGRGEGDAWLGPLVAAEGPAARQELAELEVRLAVLDGQIDAARRRTEELSHRLAADVAAGLVPAPSTVEATAEQLGRPPVRSAAPHAAMLTFAAAALAAETWQIAMPLLRAAGIDPASLGPAAKEQPAAVAFAAVFALGVSAGLFALAHAGLDAAAVLFAGDDDARRRRWLAAGAGGAAALSLLVAASLSGLPTAPGAVAVPRMTFVLLLLAVPLATSLLLRAAGRERARRAAELEGALAWDRERARALGERARRLDELSWAESEESDLAREYDGARRRVREIGLRAVAATRLAEEAERRERAALSRLAQSLVGALELDRYEFVRQASVRGAAELLAPRRRRAPESRAAIVEAPAPTPAPVPVPLEPAAEGGRLAS